MLHHCLRRPYRGLGSTIWALANDGNIAPRSGLPGGTGRSAGRRCCSPSVLEVAKAPQATNRLLSGSEGGVESNVGDRCVNAQSQVFGRTIVNSGDGCDPCLFRWSRINGRCTPDSENTFQKGGVRKQAILTPWRADELQPDRKAIGRKAARERQDGKCRKRQAITNRVPFIIITQRLSIYILGYFVPTSNGNTAVEGTINRSYVSKKRATRS